MIYIGIDVAKDKHDCFITNADGEVLADAFTIANNKDDFNDLYQRISSITEDPNKVKVGLEAIGHYSYNLLGFLLDKGFTTYLINPLHTSQDNLIIVMPTWKSVVHVICGTFFTTLQNTFAKCTLFSFIA